MTEEEKAIGLRLKAIAQEAVEMAKQSNDIVTYPSLNFGGVYLLTPVDMTPRKPVYLIDLRGAYRDEKIREFVSSFICTAFPDWEGKCFFSVECDLW